jgi:hypothetical protein
MSRPASGQQLSPFALSFTALISYRAGPRHAIQLSVSTSTSTPALPPVPQQHHGPACPLPIPTPSTSFFVPSLFFSPPPLHPWASPDGPPESPGTHPSAPTHCPFFGPPVTDCPPASPYPVAGQMLQPDASAVTLLAASSLALPDRALHVSSHGICELCQRCGSPESILR